MVTPEMRFLNVNRGLEGVLHNQNVSAVAHLGGTDPSGAMCANSQHSHMNLRSPFRKSSTKWSIL